MRTIAISELIGKSINRTGEILFHPFSSKKWLKLLLIAFLAGGMSGGNFNMGDRSSQPAQKTEQAAVTRDAGAQPDVVSAPEAVPTQEELKAAAARAGIISAEAKKTIKTIVIVSAVIVIFIILIVLLSAWIGARFRFIWFSSVVTNRADIAEPYARHAREANSYFRFSLLFTAVVLLFVAAIASAVLVHMSAVGAFTKGFVWGAGVAMKIFLAPVLTLIIGILAFMLFSFFVDEFVVPIMALDNDTILPALRKFKAIFKSSWKDILLFSIVNFGLNMAAGVCVMLLVILLALLVVLIALLVFGLPYYLIGVLLKAKLVFGIYAVVTGVPFLIAGMLALIATGLPFAVFFRQFSISYLLSLNCGYSQSSLDQYALKRVENARATVPAVLVIFFVGLMMAAIIALLAAIAIPNFILARQKAQAALAQKQAAAVSPGSTAPAV